MKRGVAAILAAWFALTLAGCTGVPRELKLRETFYLALGASDATGVGAIPLTNGYVYRIKGELEKHFSRVELLNLGVPAARIGLIKDELTVVLRLGVNPHLVTLWTGANDLIAGGDPLAFETELRTILQRLHNETTAAIVMANLPDLTKLPRFRENPSPVVTPERVQAFNDAIARQARANKVLVVNLFAQELGDALVWDLDGFHPNNEGHRVIAELFLKLILPIFEIR
ncbi:MAG: GDSL-type esterase/lipase family protein [Nitrospiraceae bacterium]